MNRHTLLSLAVASAIGSGLAAHSEEAAAAKKERCYGASAAGKNDCAAGPGTSCAGTAKLHWQGDAWRYVETGTCEDIETPYGTKGSLSAIGGQPGWKSEKPG